MKKKKKKEENWIQNNIQQKRILLIGSSLSHSSIDSFKWHELPEDYNIGDHDVVIIDSTSFEAENEEYRFTNNPISPNHFKSFLSHSENELILIGEPYHFEIKIDSWITFYGFRQLFPEFPDLISIEGQEIRDKDNDFIYYLDHVKKWSFHLYTKKDELPLEKGSIEKFHGIFDDYDVRRALRQAIINIKPLAKSVSQYPIAFSFNYTILIPKMSTSKTNVYGEPLVEKIEPISTANTFFLPPTTSLPVIEGIKLILQNRYNLILESETPEWINEYKLPEQLDVEYKIGEYEKEIKNLEGNIEKLQEPLHHVNSFQKLLYETGENLRNIVLDALENLGAKVDRTDISQDDGRLIDPFGRKATIEVKGVEKSVKRKDIRQLEDWMDTAKEKDNWESKGILIANTYIKNPLNKRKEPFPNDCSKKAISEEICLITTTQLFKALQHLQENEFNQEDFWDSIFNTNGKCDLPELQIVK
jgi:hypothetical protein